MTPKLVFQNAALVATPLLVVFAVDIATGKNAVAFPVLLSTSDAVAGAAASWIAAGEFKAGLGETLLLHSPANLQAQRLLLVGLGKALNLTVHEVRKAAGVAVRYARPRAIRDLMLAMPEDKVLADEHMDSLPCLLTARAMAEGAILADFDIDVYRSERTDLSMASVTIVHSDADKSSQAQSQQGFDEGVIVAEAQNFARSLVNEPGNILTPTELGKRAAAMCQEFSLSCEVYSLDKILELKMGAFAAVTQGSIEPPALIVMRYEPSATTAVKPGGEPAPLLGLVGKGITFDTGGISIKPAENMDKMKDDMAGAAAMIAAMQAIAQLRPPVRVLSVICSCENMPDAKAYKPGDVLTAMSGKTIEVLNTDAEGRLVLADGLHYAQTLGATHLINAATLTGAIGVALGLLTAGVFSNSDEAAERFLGTFAVAGENFWRMPCGDIYRDTIKSQIADIMNTGGSRYGGSISAAMFLKEFVGETPWLHLDIAATAWTEEARPWQSKGPTGVAVRSIIEWVRSFGR